MMCNEEASQNVQTPVTDKLFGAIRGQLVTQVRFELDLPWQEADKQQRAGLWRAGRCADKGAMSAGPQP